MKKLVLSTSTRRILILATLILTAASPVLASGFSIFEQSAKASGQAGAWSPTRFFDRPGAVG